ncbi:MAG: VWA domain-containing protein [Candidatus Methanomethylophilus sp.]|nr:VWA domain-containing protein [Methanomethylophilus sp.]
MPAEPLTYPYAALVGLTDAKQALECALVNPRLKAVLIRGGEGTAKTTAARAAAGITSRKIVNCPLNVTVEQLFGGLDLEKALKTGKTKLEPGLLARADGNILYIDDVNLMDRSTLAAILDAVRTGEVKVERGPISAVYPCCTTLVATMNPADTDLSAHMLDRFDLCACVGTDEKEDERREILRRNAEYAARPQEFSDLYVKEDEEVRARILRAQRILPLVTVSDELVSIAAELCIKVGADGSRGDVAVIECAETLAALNGRDEVRKNDIEEAAALCLSHRRNYTPPPPPPPPQPPEPPPDQPPDDDRNKDQKPPEQQPPEPPPQPDKEDKDEPPPEKPPELPNLEEMMFEIGRQFRVIDYLESHDRIPARTKTRKGRRALAESGDGTGRYARARLSRGQVTDVAFDATIRAAAPYQRTRHRDGLALDIEKQDLREKVRERRSGCTLLFVVDASGSLGVRRRMTTVKGAILSMLRDSYVRRDRIGLMAFRRDSAEMILPPTKSVEYSYHRLEELPTGGRTPLGEALVRTDEFMTSYVRCHPGERCFVVLVTDGRANVPLKDGADANAEVQKLAGDLRIPGVRWIVVDAGQGYPHFDNAERLAEKLEARYFQLEDLDADRFAAGVRAAVNT